MIRISTAVFCEICGDWLEIGGATKRAQIRKMRQEAKTQGWLCAVRVPDGSLEDYCPDCQNQAPEPAPVL